MKLQYKISILIFIVGLALAIIGIGIHQKITLELSNKKALHDIQSLSQEMAISVDSILREKANKVQSFANAPVIQASLLESNAAFSHLSPAERQQNISRLNNRLG